MIFKVSRSFLRDFAFIANLYEWDSETIEEVKAQTRGNLELMAYWTRLAVAHRSGYEQTKSNRWIRLEEWEQLQENN